MHSLDDLVLCFSDLNNYVGRNIDGVHQGYSVGQRNWQGRILLVLSGERIVYQVHGLREEKRKVKFRLGKMREKNHCG